MADNTTLNVGASGDVVRDIDRSGVKTQVVQLDAGGSSAEALVSNAAGAGMPIRDTNVIINATAVTATGVISGAGFDTTGYASIHFDFVGTAFSGSIQVQWSENNSTWAQGNFFTVGTVLPSGTSSSVPFINSGPYFCPVVARYVRFNVTSFSSATSALFTAVLRSAPCPIEYLNVNISGTGTSVGVAPSSLPPSSAVGTTAFVKSAATTNATSVKASAGNLYGGVLTNNSAAVKYFKIYNKASAPTVGTDTPVAVLAIPANGGQCYLGDNCWAVTRLSTGIAYAITGAVADSDTTAVAVNDVSGWLLYA